MRARHAWLAVLLLGMHGTACSREPMRAVGQVASWAAWATATQVAISSRLIAEARGPCPDYDQRITADAIAAHLRAFDDIAQKNGGNRAALTTGYAASVDYVRTQLDAVHISSERMTFAIPDAKQLGPGALVMVLPEEKKLVADRDYNTLSGSPPGDVTGELVAIDVAPLGPSTSGCEATDFDNGVASGKIALLQRGTCPFADKVRHAQQAGAIAAIVFNHRPDGTISQRLTNGTVLHGNTADPITIPALFTTSATGVTLRTALQRGRVEVRVLTETKVDMSTSESLLAEVAGDAAGVWMIGAHLDSVPEGPGINDNASGSAALIELARQLAHCETTRGVRFAWWGAEEMGLRGSRAYVAALGKDHDVAGYINLDMLGAANHVFTLGDGDGSLGRARSPEPSAGLEAFFRSDFARRKIPLVEVPFQFRSDYAPFHEAGIGVADLSAGYDAPKSAQHARLFGGQAGKPPDACYHQKCDNLGNVHPETVATIARAVAAAIARIAIDGAAPSGEK